MAQAQLDEKLQKAIEYLLLSISERNELVNDLLVIEIEWTTELQTNQVEPTYIEFQGRRWPLIYTSSELVIRRILCQAGNEHVIIVIPTGFEVRALRDVLARAYGGSAQRVGLRHQLYAFTERVWPVEVDEPEWAASIQQHMQALTDDIGALNIANRTLSREQLEQSLVKAAYGLTLSESNDAKVLASLSLLQRKQTRAPSRLESSLLQGQLNAAGLKWSGILLWAATETGRAEELIRTGIMIAAERQARRMPSWGKLNSLRALLINQYQLAEEEALTTISNLAINALDVLHPNVARRIARDAEKELLAVLPADVYNRWFPAMLTHACEQVAKRLALRDQSVTSRPAELENHLFATPERAKLDALKEMASLVAFWSQQIESVEILNNTSAWAIWYAHNGATLDWTALRLKQCYEQSVGLEAPMGQLLDTYWRWRSGLNHKFAETWLGHYEESIHDRNAHVFGVHRILQWVIQPLLKAEKRVLLIVMDGMGYVAFRSLMTHWSEEDTPVYADEAQIGLTLLPSVTSVARKGLFLGKLPTDHLDDEESYNEKAKINELKALKQAFPNTEVALYHKGTLAQLATEFAFQRADLVAVIFNHIDDELSSKNHNVYFPTLKQMGPLVQIVDSALRSGWSVVMTSDHGHTWHRSTDLRQMAIVRDGGERYISVTSQQQFIPPEAIVTSDPNIVSVHEGKKIALLTENGAYFGSQPRRGYHGGASLEEAVVPCAILSYDAAAQKTIETTETTFRAEQSPNAPSAQDMEGIILKLRDGRTVDLTLPIALASQEARLLQILAQMGEASEEELRKALNTRRVAGIVARLSEQLTHAGPMYDYIEQTSIGAEGVIYRFRAELLR